MREEGLEPSRVAPRDPKSRASASSATLAVLGMVGAKSLRFNENPSRFGFLTGQRLDFREWPTQVSDADAHETALRHSTDMKRAVPLAAMVVSFTALASGCISASPAADKVRITSNPDGVPRCQFLGTVKATSEWEGGPADTGIDSNNNTEVALREKKQRYRLARHRVEDMMKRRTAALGGNVLMNVNITSAGIMSGSGKAYFCPAQPP